MPDRPALDCHAEPLLHVVFIGPCGFDLSHKHEARSDRLAHCAAEATMRGLPKSVLSMMDNPVAGTCGACVSFEEGRCTARSLGVGAGDPSCPLYLPRAFVE